MTRRPNTPRSAARAPRGEGVALFHGLGRTRMGMQLLAHRLRGEGFETSCVPYRSRRLSLAEAVELAGRAVDAHGIQRAHVLTERL